MTTNTTTTTKLASMPYAQAHIVIDSNGDKILVSYNTAVALLTADGWLTISGLYSQTTRRHISAFMKENGSSYAVAKSAYNAGKTINIYTGEVVK